MRPRPDGLLRAVGAGGAGAIWGLGLARLGAEAGFCSFLHGSLLGVAGVVAMCAVLAGAVAAVALRRAAVFIPLILPFPYVVGLTPGPLAGCVLLIGGALLALLLAWGDRARWMPPAVLGLATLGLYLRTLLPGVGQADTFEFQVVVPLLRVAHPTGYPLYVLLGKLFTLLPLGSGHGGGAGSVAWRVNLASAVFATAAVLVLYALLTHLLTRPRGFGEPGLRRAVTAGDAAEPGQRAVEGVARWLPALLAALAFAFSATLWSQAIVAEVYALHNLLAALILYLLLAACPHAPTSPHAFLLPRRWQLIFLLLGLSFTNHLTTALLVPAVALALLWDRPRLRLRDWLFAAALFLLGLSVYLFIPLRWPALNRGQWMTLREFVSYVTGGQFHAALQLDGWRDPVRWRIVGRLLREPFGWVGVGLAAAGVAGMAIYRRRALALTGVTFLAFFVYGLDYYVPDISVFLLPAHLILAIWIGAGLAGLITLATFHPPPSNLQPPPSTLQSPTSNLQLPTSNLQPPTPNLLQETRFFRKNPVSSIVCHLSFSSFVILSALLPLSRIWLNLPTVDQSRNHGNTAWGQYVLSLPLAPDSAILADVEKFAPLYYLQQIEGLRPDLDVILLGSEELYQAELAARLAAGQTVYLARYLPNLEGLYLCSVGPLVEVSDQACAGGQVPGGTGVRFGEEIRLLDADLSADPLGRALYHVTLRWAADARVSGDFAVRLRLVGGVAQVHWESEGVRPVGGLYPTNAWPTGVAISDYHELALPPWLPPGAYTLEVGLFPPFGERGLGVDGGTTEWLALDTLQVVPRSGPLSPLAHERRSCFAGGAWLTGYNVGGEAFAGAPFVVDLSWRGVGADTVVRLAWVDADGREAGSGVFPLAAGSLRSRHVISAPQRPGGYALHVGLVGETVRCGWLAPSTAQCPLSPVKVLPAQEGLARFADLFLLLDAEVGEAAAQPGGVVPVALRWRALRAMDEDYTAFVHLVGPDGRLRGQVDAWPVQGSYPTSRWSPGEEVSDPYEVRLDSDAPPGLYRVEVGWYLLATMQRLQVVDAEGHPSADSFVVGEFSVGE